MEYYTVIKSLACQHTPITPVTQEAEAEGPPEHKSSRLDWTTQRALISPPEKRGKYFLNSTMEKLFRKW